jgi:hypothetical protein
MQDSWPSADHEAERASPLPRVEDLPYVERGYDPERVREAFDAFYRHLARLDATLRTIEAVEVFRGQADELRKELRALRTAGWTQQPWLPSYAARERARPGVPEAVFRWGLEACFVIAVPVAAAVADLRSLWIIVAAAGAFAIVAIAEWAASRERDVLPAPVAPPAAPSAPVEEPEPAAVVLPPVEPAPGEATEWTLPPPVEEPEPEEPEQEELTVVGAAGVAEAAEPEPEPVAEALVVEPAEPAAEPEPEPEPEPPRRRRFRWRRERVAEEPGEAEPDEDRPKHVRVLPPEAESRVEPLDPWEEELDAEPEPESTRRG